MKIVVDGRAASHPQRGGFKTYTEQLMMRIARVDPENEYVFYLDRATETRRFDGFPNVTSKIIPSSVRAIGAAWREQVDLPRHLAVDQPEIMHSTSNTAPIRAPCATVITVHDTIALQERPPLKGLAVPELPKRWGMFLYNRYLSLAAARRARRLITVSNYSRRDLIDRHHFPAERVVVTYQAPSDCFIRKPKPVATEAVHSRFAIARPFLLALTSASPRKNAHGLLEAYAQLEPELREAFRLVIVWTHGLLKNRLAARVRELGLARCVVFLEGVSDTDLVNLYNAATLFVFPSFAEGFGLPPLEAMACGTPVVASSLSSMPEVLGDAALLVDPRSPGELTRGIALALSSPQLLTELRAKGQLWVQRYSWDQCAVETARVYAQAVAESQLSRNV